MMSERVPSSYNVSLFFPRAVCAHESKKEKRGRTAKLSHVP